MAKGGLADAMRGKNIAPSFSGPVLVGDRYDGDDGQIGAEGRVNGGGDDRKENGRYRLGRFVHGKGREVQGVLTVEVSATRRRRRTPAAMTMSPDTAISAPPSATSGRKVDKEGATS